MIPPELDELVEFEDKETSSLVCDVFGGIPSVKVGFCVGIGDHFRSQRS